MRTVNIYDELLNSYYEISYCKKISFFMNEVYLKSICGAITRVRLSSPGYCQYDVEY